MTLPTEWALKLPDSISDESSSALLATLAERWDNIGVERALVWHFGSVVEAALPHLAEGLGLARMAFVGGPPRDFIETALELVRYRGTVGALEEALVAIGYLALDFDIREDTDFRLDGSWELSGEPYRLGSDSHWSTYWVQIAAPLGIPNTALAELWDVVFYMRPERSRPVLIIETTAGPLVYRSREELPS